MSAPTPATGDGSPTPGYYPDPSIPGYVRFWNGGAWVPGTSRPAPADGEALPSAPAATSAPAPTPVVPPAEETGPMFFDEEPEPSSRQEPASAWQADTSRQTGFGGERDQRVSWGGPVPSQAPAQDPRGIPAQPPAAAQQQAAELPAAPTPAALPPVRQAPSEGTALIRRTRRPEPAPEESQEPAPDRTTAIRAVRPQAASAPTNRTDGTMAIRSIQPNRTPNQAQAQAAPQAQTPAQAQPAPLPVQPQQPRPEALNSPTTPGPGGGSASWAQQVHQLAQPDAPQQQSPQQQSPQAEPQQAAPWKPPTLDPFAQLAQAQANARPAGLGRRLAARLIDTVVLGAAVGAIATPFVTKAVDHINAKIDEAKLSGETVTVWLLDGTTATYLGIVLGAFLVLGVLYEALPTAKWGRTLGKKLCGIDVRGIESHEPPGFAAALRRWLVYGILGLLAIGVLNVLWCLFDRPWRQCWHDKAAGTFVAAG
ncbi:RDD family protein [Streptomyces sp. NBC_01465]|uniref:RDD family protein n=1 Tax=Streptomyces sp. NBC_01465 TaxID=2903878 RepID=UPI002E36B4AE|nr:RDD family protein [Streptomyces sp. NBC_01465]